MSKETGIYAPDYYKKFRCIADRCRHSCCVDWEICIDDAAYAKYQQIDSIRNTIEVCEDGPCFALTENGRCPHWNAEGLCNIILSYGEAYLSEICRNHPRFYHEIGNGRVEAGLGIVCEEACRLILEEEAPFSLSKVEELDGDGAEEDIADFDVLSQRDHIIAVLEAEGDFDTKVSVLRSEFAIPAIDISEAWLDLFLSLEILDPSWGRDLRTLYGKPLCAKAETFARYEAYGTRLLIYFVYRHVSIASSRTDLRARLAFAMLSAKLIRLLWEAGKVHTAEAFMELARRYSAEIEYSEENTAELIFAWEAILASYAMDAPQKTEDVCPKYMKKDETV